jgi:hypothetical protein
MTITTPTALADWISEQLADETRSRQWIAEEAISQLRAWATAPGTQPAAGRPHLDWDMTDWDRVDVAGVVMAAEGCADANCDNTFRVVTTSGLALPVAGITRAGDEVHLVLAPEVTS